MSDANAGTLQQQIEALLYREAALLDASNYQAWLALYTDDASYWLPRTPEQTDPLTQASIIYENKAVLALRVARLEHPRAHAVMPPPRTLHTVSNVLIDTDANSDRSATNAAISVASALLLVECREQEQRLFAARVKHRLQQVPVHVHGEDNAADKAWRITAKRVDLLNSDGILPVLSVPF